MLTTTQHSQPPAAASQHALPDPGEQVPTLSWPIVGIFTFALALFGASTWAALTDTLPAIATIAASAAAIFVLFTVLHDASHYSISSHRWVNVAFGRVAMFFVSPLISFKSFAFIHIEHHRNTNDGANDPDHFVSAAPWWQLPVRFPAMDLPYIGLLVRNLRRRPRAEILETAALMAFSVTVIVAAAFTGHLWTLALIYLIPERVAMFVLAWWFDWLPHHDLEDTQRENRYRATRNRVGSEWILTPLLLSQNYHLVHHLHPSIPFYRYVADVATQRGGLPRARRRDRHRLRAAARPRRVPGVEGAQRQAGCGCCRSGCRVRSSGYACRRSTRSRSPASTRLTADSVLSHASTCPRHLRDQFRFEPGQHLTVEHRPRRRGVRRNYSICAPADSGTAGDRASSTSPAARSPPSRSKRLRGRRRPGADDANRQFGTLDALARRESTMWRSQPAAASRPCCRSSSTTHGDRDREPLHPVLRQPTPQSRPCSPRTRRARSSLRRPATRSSMSAQPTAHHPARCAAASTGEAQRLARSGPGPASVDDGSCVGRVDIVDDAARRPRIERGADRARSTSSCSRLQSRPTHADDFPSPT